MPLNHLPNYDQSSLHILNHNLLITKINQSHQTKNTSHSEGQQFRSFCCHTRWRKCLLLTSMVVHFHWNSFQCFFCLHLCGKFCIWFNNSGTLQISLIQGGWMRIAPAQTLAPNQTKIAELVSWIFWLFLHRGCDWIHIIHSYLCQWFGPQNHMKKQWNKTLIL